MENKNHTLKKNECEQNNFNPSNITNVDESALTGKSTWTIGKEFKIELGHGVSKEDTLLAQKDKNAIDFVFDYSKLWCKSCKDLVFSLEKRANAETECARAVTKQFQVLELSITNVNGVPVKSEILELSRMLIENYKEIENNNLKRCRELHEVLNLQRTLFEKTRKHLKDKWKLEVKRMVDAEHSLFKTKSAYYQRCQAGVKLREELTNAQNLLNEFSTQSSVLSNVASSNPVNLITTSNTNLNTEAIDSSGTDSNLYVTNSTSNQAAKQKVKVERLEKQLADNDKKEIELMYAYREAVDIANNRLCELGKCKVEILCDIRLTITKSDEAVKESVSELLMHLYNVHMAMIKKYELVSKSFKNYLPCSDYLRLVETHTQKTFEFLPEKYHFDGFHESSYGRGTASRNMNTYDSNFEQLFSKTQENLYGLHSDSESDTEFADVQTALTNRNSGLVSTSSNVLSSIVEFGSNLFKPDLKKSFKNKRAQPLVGNQALDLTENNAIQEALLEKEYHGVCYNIARCIAAIEAQSMGLMTHGIYRVPASKVKVANIMDILQSNQPTTDDEVNRDIKVLVEEQSITLANFIKGQLISLPEPLLTYNLYSYFVELGKLFDVGENVNMNDLVKKCQVLINTLSSANRQLAGLLFHHLYRVSIYEKENQMGSLNLGTMFAPTVLRQKPKFQVANMMEFMDNKGQVKILEILINEVVQIFGPADQYNPIKLILCCSSYKNNIQLPVKSDSIRSSSPITPTSLVSISEQSGFLTNTVKTNNSNTNSNINLKIKRKSENSTIGLLRSATISASNYERYPLSKENILDIPDIDAGDPVSKVESVCNLNTSLSSNTPNPEHQTHSKGSFNLGNAKKPGKRYEITKLYESAVSSGRGLKNLCTTGYQTALGSTQASKLFQTLHDKSSSSASNAKHASDNKK